ncbi:MAG: NTP/NDP exchange transporter [Puniceicoccales bacterium]|jgi:AAA family ATP:ADP antiporter|nr:NTP/NDP exchange transporter [Puniceicoccales bacterium]
MSGGDQAIEFSKLRKILFPIKAFEIKKALPMGMMFFCILLNYTLLRNLKDAVNVTATNSGAEVLPFLKSWLVMPSAVFFMLLYAKGSDFMSSEKLFYVTVGIFLLFFAIFGWVLCPNLEYLQPSVETVKRWQASWSPAFHWPIAIIGNWINAIFFVMSELWGSAALSLLFWQFANQTCKISEAKRFYSFFGLLGQFSLLAAGFIAGVANRIVKGGTQWVVVLRWLMVVVVCSGLIAMAIYRWVYKCVLTDKRFYDKPELPGIKKKEKMGFWQSMEIMITSPYLGLIAALVICYGIGVNVIEALWKGQVKLMYPNPNDFNAFMGRYSSYTGLASIVVMIIGGNILRTFSWFTAAVITPTLTLVAGSTFFAFILWRDSFVDALARLGTNPLAVAVFTGVTILILAKSTKYALFDLTKEMAYIPLDEDMKIKGKAVVEVVGGRLGKASGAWIQALLLMILGAIYGRRFTLIELTPYLLGTLIIICSLWILSVRALNRKILAVTAASGSHAKSN